MINAILRTLSSARIRSSTEAQMHEDVAAALEDAGASFSRERQLTPQDRIDFLVAGGIGIECKIDGTPTEVARQMIRYAASREITCLILVTSRSRLGHHLPNDIHGKPVRVVTTWRNAL